MTKAMEVLFYEWLENEIADTPSYEDILEQYSFEEYLSVTSAVVEEQKLAFCAGFKTAVQLLMGGASE